MSASGTMADLSYQIMNPITEQFGFTVYRKDY